jgi:hypothetical protein
MNSLAASEAPPTLGQTMTEVANPEEIAFLNGLRSQMGKRIRIWYDVESSDGASLREVVEGRLTSMDSQVTLLESRQIHPSLADDHGRRTASISSLRGYAEMDQRTGTVTNTVLRRKRSSL